MVHIIPQRWILAVLVVIAFHCGGERVIECMFIVHKRAVGWQCWQYKKKKENYVSQSILCRGGGEQHNEQVRMKDDPCGVSPSK